MASAALELLIQLKDEASSGLAAITGGLGNVGKAALTVAGGGLLAIGGGLTAAIGAGLNFNNSMEQVSAQLMAFTKDGAATAAILDMIKTRAASTPFAFEDMATAATALLPASKAAGVGLEELIAQAEILAASNPAEGLEGAAFALKEAAGGDFQSAIERFNLPRQYINQLKEEGVPNLEILSRAMGQLGLDADLVSGLANTASGRWSTFLDTLTNVAAEVSKPIFEAFSSSLAGIQAILDANTPAIMAFASALAGQLSSAIQWLISAGVPMLVSGWASLQPALATAGEALTVISGLLGLLFAAFTGGQTSIFEFATVVWGLASVFGLTVEQSTGVVNAITSLGQVFQSLWTAVQPLIPSLQDALMPALVGLAAVVGGGIVVALGSMIAAMVAAAAPIVALVAAAGVLYAAWSSNFLGLRDIVTGALSAVLGIVMAVAGQIVAFWQANGAQILATAAQVWGQLQAIIGGALQIVVTVVQTVLGAVVSFIQAHGATIQAVFSAVWGALAAVVTSALNIIRGIITTVLAVIKGDWAGAWEGLKATVAAVWTGIGAVIKAGIALIGAALKLVLAVITDVGKGVLSAAIGVGKAMVDGVISGVKAAGTALFGALKDMASGALSAAKAALGIASPSKVMADQVGKFIPAGIGQGITQGIPALNQNVTRNLGNVIDQARRVAGTQTMANQVGKPMIDGIGAGFSAGMPAIKSKIESGMRGLVNSAKKTLQIASPSAVMAKEIGAPIVDGIVAGLVQRSPKAVQAMLDLASSMFDVVSKGVEAFGKLTQLGTIPQSAILNFSDAIQRTLTEFSNRVGQWDKAAMSAASQFTYKAGQVVEFLQKGVELLTGIANMAAPSRGAITEFANSLAWVMTEIVRVSTFELRLGLTAGVEFASGAGAIVDVIKKGVEALNSLADFVKPAPGVITQFVNVVYWLVSRFVAVGQAFAGQALGAATAFAAAAGQVFAVVASGVDALMKLGEFVKPAPGVIQSFANVVYWLVSRFVLVAQGISGPALNAASAFADGAGKVITIIAAGVDGLLKLGEFVRPAPGVVQQFANTMYWLVSRFVEVAGAIGQRGVAAAAAFAEGAGKAIGLLGAGVDGFVKLQNFRAVPQESILAFEDTLYRVVEELIQVTENFTEAGLNAANKFALAVEKPIGIIGSAVDGFTKLLGFRAVPQESILAFEDTLYRVVEELIQVTENFTEAGLAAAKAFALAVEKPIGIIGAAVDGFAKLLDFQAVPQESILAFEDTLYRVVEELIQVTENFTEAGLAAATKFAESASKILGVLKTGVDGLSALGDLKPVSEQAIALFVALVDQLITDIAAASGAFSVDALAQAQKFSTAAGAAVGILEKGVRGLLEVNAFAGVSEQAITRFADGVKLAVAAMARLAGEFGAEATAAAKAFAQAAGESTDFLKKGADGLFKVSEFTAVPLEGLRIFASGVQALVRMILELSKVVTEQMIADAVRFSVGIDQVIQVITGGLKAFKDLGLAANSVSTFMSNFALGVSKLVADFKNATISPAQDIGMAISLGIAAGINAGTPAIINAVYDAVSQAILTARQALGIASPSKVFEQIGQYAGEGMVGGMTAMQPALAGAGAGLGMAAAGGASGTVAGRGESAGAAITFGAGAIVLNGVQGGIGERELRRLAQLIKEEIANERGGR